MATVIYGGNAVIPAPLVTINKIYQSSDDGTHVGSLYNIQLKGKLSAFQGSPDSNGSFWNLSGYPPDEVFSVTQGMGSIIRKQSALRALFSAPGQTLEFQPPDGSAPLACNPRVLGIEFAEGQWFQTCDYTVTLEADTIYGIIEDDLSDISTYHVSKASEDWAIEIIDQNLKTYRLTHQVTATGKRFFGTDGGLTQAAWQNAQDFVLNKIGLGLVPARMNPSDVLPGADLQAYNYIRAQSVGEWQGTFGVTETWLCYSPPDGIAAYVETKVDYRKSVLENRTVVTIEGTITGLEVRDNNDWSLLSSRYDNALAKWNTTQTNLLSDAQTISGVTLNPTPMITSEGINQIAGTIIFSVQYDSRPIASIPGALTQIVSVTDVNPANIFASLIVPGDALGPVLQDIQTVTARKRQISIEVQMPPASIVFSPAKPDTLQLILDNRPTGSAIFLDEDAESWVQYTGRYTRNTSYTWET